MQVRIERGLVIRRLAPLAVMPAGAFAVHQLRYWLAFGGQAGSELARQGHSYLHSLVPWIVLLLAVSFGGFLAALGRALRGQRSLRRYTLSFVALWLLAALCLVAIYATQEFLEGLFATGHPSGLTGIFGYGGWWSIPAALLVGLLLAAALHGARWVLHAAFARHSRVAPKFRRPIALPLPHDIAVPRLAPLAEGWSGRGPPR